MIKLTFYANGDHSTREIVQNDVTNAEKSALLVQLEVMKRDIVDSFDDDWMIEDSDDDDSKDEGDEDG